MMQMSCKVIKALSGYVNGAVPRGEDYSLLCFVFAYELVLFLIKRNHCYGDCNPFIKISL